MDIRQRQIGYREPKLLPFDGRAKLVKFLGEAGDVGLDGFWLFSAKDEFIGTFESPQHAKIWCAAAGYEIADVIEENLYSGAWRGRSPYAEQLLTV